jgi:hypothetical protein
MRFLKSILVILTVLSLAPRSAAAVDGCEPSIIGGCTEYCAYGECFYHVCCEHPDYESVWGYCPGYGGHFSNPCGGQH